MSPYSPLSPTQPLLEPVLDLEKAREENACLKRSIADMKESTMPSSNKRPTSTATLGRGIRRLVTMFQDLPTLVREADRREEEIDDDLSDDDIGESDDPAALQRNRNRTYGAWQELLLLVPIMKTYVVTHDAHSLASFYSMLMRGASDARSDDIGNLKKGVAGWLNKYPATQPPLDPDDRVNRGLQHDTTGALLCPIEYDWSDVDIRAKLRACEEGFDPSCSFFVRCFYPGGSIDPDDVENGFLRGSLLVKVFSTIFTSPSSANRIADDHNVNDENLPPSDRPSSSKATKSSVATKLHLEKVTPRSIAYSAVLLHFSLTDAPSWKAMYNGFSYELLYNFIVDYFEETDNPIAKENSQALLRWWNKQIFPTRAQAISNSRSSRKKLEQQRAARMARRI